MRNAGAACGIDLLEPLFRVLDPDVRVQQVVAESLTVERTALDTLQRLSGIATLTVNLVARLAGRNVELSDTRKTTLDGGISRSTRCVAVATPFTSLIMAGTAMIKDNH